MTVSTSDTLLGGRVVLEQPDRGFRASIDAVLLAAAVVAPQAARVLDVGCGTGAAALCLAWRRPDVAVVGLEIDPRAVELALRNAEQNAEQNAERCGREARIRVVEGDLMAPPEALERSFDVVMTNPPFHPPTGHFPTGSRPTGHRYARRPATGEVGRADERVLAMVDTAGPAAWLNACLARLSPGGRLALIHRADRLPAVMAALEPGAGAIEIIPLWPNATSGAAKRVIVRCRKQARGAATLRRGLVLHGETGMFSEAAEAILRHGAALDEVLGVG